MQQPHKLITWIVIIGVIIVTVIVVVGYVMTNNTSTPQVVAQMPMQATSSVPVQETHTTETQAVAQIAIPQSKVLLEDSILKNTNFASRLFVSDDASNVIYYFTASSGHLKIFANGVLSPEYATLLQGTVISSDQRLVVSPVMGLKKQFVVTNGVASRPYDGILHAPVLSSDGKHYVYVAFSGNSQFTVLDGKEVANDDAPGANGTSKRLKPVFSGNAARMAFITGRSDMGTRVHSNILIHDTKSGQKEEELTAHFPGLLAFSDDGKIFGYADEGEIVIRDESGEKVSERRFPLDTSGVGSLVISSDGKHWAFGNSFGAPPRKQQLWIDGKQISTLIPYGANLLSLTFNMKGDNLAYHVSGISDVGVIVHDTDGNVIGKYMISNSDGRYQPGLFGFLKNGSVFEMLLHIITMNQFENVVMIDGKQSDSSLIKLFPNLQKKDQDNFLASTLGLGSASWQDFDPTLSSPANILNIVRNLDSQQMLSIRADIDNPLAAAYQGKSFHTFVQLGNATTSAYDVVALPIFSVDKGYFTFGAISNGRIFYNVYKLNEQNSFSMERAIDTTPKYKIDSK